MKTEMPTPVPRPHARLSTEQVITQLRLAREYFVQSGFVTGSPHHTSSDLHALDLISADEQLAGIEGALDEIVTLDYRGPHPPNHESKEPKCKSLRMLQFSWRSARFNNRRMFIKFCLHDRRFLLLRLHEEFNPNKFTERTNK